MARIDVVIPCYNYGRYLAVCVQSVLEQSAGDLRVLIIDDASSDNSVAVARMLAKADRRVSVIAHVKNQGHIKTFNEGIEWAEGDYFLLLSADDLLVPGAFDRAIRVMDANPDIVMTYGECVAWYDHLPLPPIEAASPFTWSRTNLVRDMCAIASNFVPTPTAIVRTSSQKAIGGYLPTLPHAGDLEMWLRFAAHGGVARIHSLQAIYRKHASAMSNPYWGNILSDYRQRKSAFDTFFDQYGDHIPGLASLRKTTDRVQANKAFQSGLGYMRRGRIGGGFQLLRWAMSMDRRLRYFPPLWRSRSCRGRKDAAGPLTASRLSRAGRLSAVTWTNGCGDEQASFQE
jgi:glycosyltransferase involved in cell wall biosynthesis